MARVSIDILGIRELKWTGMDEFNSDDHYIYYCGQESLRRNGVVHIIHRVRNAVLGCNLKNDGRPGFDPWVGKIPWRRKWQPAPVILPGECHGQRNLVG